MTIALEEPVVKKMSTSSFKANCLAVIKEVQTKRVTVVIPKCGKPIAKLVPVDSGAHDIYGFIAGKAKITGDIVRPVLTLKEWGNLA